jgi:Phage portal protein, SPP1 Gp6-like
MEELKELVAAQPAYIQAESYYYNTVAELFASTKLRSLLQTTADRFRLNYAATPIDVLTERTVINGITCTTPAAQAVIDDLWETNRLGITAKDLHRSVYTYGDSYLLAWTDDNGELSVFRHDPRSVRVFYDIENPNKKTSAIHTWVGDDEHLYVALYDLDKATIYKSTTTADALDPNSAEFTAQSSTPNPVPGTIPVFHFRNADQYGRPEHADAYGPQDMINKLTVTMMASIDHAGFPQRYILTDSGLDSGATADFSDDDEAPTYDSSPGTNWLLTGSNLKVGQFAVAESTNFLKPIESLVRQMSVVTDTPMHYFDLSGEPPSGAALRAADFPLNKKANDRQMRLGVAWREFFEFVLEFNNSPADVMILWAPPGIVDDKEFWETQLLKKQLGVPIEELLREGGYTDALIEEFDVQSVTDNDASRSDGSSLEEDLGTSPPAENS